MYYAHRKCRACGATDLVPVLSLGHQPPANNFHFSDAERLGHVPLTVLYCPVCTLAQLSAVVKPEILYRNYPYVTSKSKTMFDHFRNLVRDIEVACGKLGKDLNWLEIGSNDGTFLAQLPCPNHHRLGFEPAKNLSDIANARDIKTVNQEFSEPAAVELGAVGYRADVAVARHVFAHIDNWKGFIRALEFITHKKSLVVIEVPWVVDMFKKKSWDQVYHEHLSYVSIGAIHKLLEGTSFYLSDVIHYEIHGGAIALILRRTESGVFKLNPDFYGKSDEKDLHGDWLALSADKLHMANDLNTLIRSKAFVSKNVCGFGASAKATVWLNACGLTAKNISFVCDSTVQKQGKIIPGTNIEVVPEERLMEADYAICFSWNFFPEISEKFKAFENKGGNWIIPVPYPRVMK